MAGPRSRRVSAVEVDGWFAELKLLPSERTERDGVTSWDFSLDGRRRFDIRVTVILEPATALIVWVHFAPPIMDAQRRSYWRLLHWNDRFPFVKFALAEDERPILSAEIPIRHLTFEEVGVALARLLAICDLLLEESAGWLWIGGKIPVQPARISRQALLLTRYAAALTELSVQ